MLKQCQFDIHVCLRVKCTFPLCHCVKCHKKTEVESEGPPDGERNDKAFTTFFTDFERYQNGYFDVSIWTTEAEDKAQVGRYISRRLQKTEGVRAEKVHRYDRSGSAVLFHWLKIVIGKDTVNI